MPWRIGVATLAAALAAQGLLWASEARRSATVQIVEQARPSIVNIHGQKNLGPGDEGYHQGEPPQRVNGMGTGVVVDPRGYIVTNHHVVEGVKKIEVTLYDERTYIARLVSHDPQTDLALIKINVPEKMAPIKIGTSSDLMPGESVIAVGNAYGYEHTVTRGIISALRRTVPISDTQSYRDLIQTDASINPGNSGGPLLNMDGELVGINVAVRAGAQGIGFAIPIDMALEVATSLMSVERLDQTYHGLATRPEGLPQQRRVVVTDLDDDGPAAKGGLRSGDVVVSVAGENVSLPLDIERALLGRKPGDEVELKVRRAGKLTTLPLTLASLPRGKANGIEQQTWDLLGLRLAPVSREKVLEGRSRYRGGLRVLSVRPESPAAEQRIARGDILVGMHKWETISLDNVAYILNRADLTNLEPLKFYVVRGDETLYGHLSVSARQETRR